MKRYVIEGGKKLEGTTYVSGSKNASLPIIAATILNGGINKLYNVPNIHDTQMMFKILEILGCKIKKSNGKIVIDSRNITSYEIYTKESNENISSVKDLNELREKLGLYALGTQTDELTLKEIGTPGLGISDDISYAYIDYKFENNSGKIFKMKYIFNDGESQDDINLEIDKKYNVTFEVVEGFIHIEYNIKSINQ